MNDKPKTVGSTLTPSSAIAPAFEGDSLSVTKSIALAENKIVAITHDYKESTTDKLPSSKALHDAYDLLQRNMNEINSAIDKIYYVPVLSDPLINPYFIDPNWMFVNFFIDNNKAVFVNKKPAALNQAKLRIKNEAIIKMGKYFIYLEVDALPSGTITIVTESGVVLKTIASPGKYSLEVDIASPAIAYIDFVVNNLSINASCSLLFVSFHHVKSIFETYMEFVAAKFNSGGSGFVTGDDLNSAVNNLTIEYKGYVNSVIGSIDSLLKRHMADMFNPHGITPSKIAAAAAVHTHLLADVTDSKQLTDSFDALVIKVTDLVTSIGDFSEFKATADRHFADRDNPHEIDLIKIGAAAAVHTHFLSSITDIATITSAIERNTTTLDNFIVDYQAFKKEVGAGTDSGTQALDEHKKAMNPHGITAATVYLDKVFNASMATVAEARDGVVDDKYMNPQVAKAALDYKLELTGSIPARLRTTQLATIKLISTSTRGAAKTIEVKPGKMYLIAFATAVDKAYLLTMGFGSTQIRNTVYSDVTGSLVKTTKDDTSYVFTTTSTAASSERKLRGTLMLDTIGGTLTGTLSCESNAGVPGILLYASKALGAVGKRLSFWLDADPSLDPMYGAAAADILVYEYIEYNQESSAIVDALPIGSIVQRAGAAVTPSGYSQLDGSQLSVIENRELYQYAIDNNLLISESEYNNAITTNGYCEQFGTYTAELFNLPKDKLDNTTILRRFMKIKSVEVPYSQNILYRYLWK